jgi:hypothetical protein
MHVEREDDGRREPYFLGTTVSFNPLPIRNLRVVLAGI